MSVEGFRGTMKERKRQGIKCFVLVLVLVLVLALAPVQAFAPSLRTRCLPLHRTSPTSRIRDNSRPSYELHTSRKSPALAAHSLQPAPSTAGSVYMFLLAIQFAFQPIFTKRYAPKTIIRGTYVLAQDGIRILSCIGLLWLTGSWTSTTKGWSLSGAWFAAGMPSMLYLVQNYCSLAAYQNLAPITYNVLNQTKTLSAAVWCYVLLNQMQSRLQIVSLFILLLAALVMESLVPLPFRGKQVKESLSDENVEVHWVSGVLPIMAASMISGLAGALVQRSLQVKSRNSLLLSSELAAFSFISNIVALLAGSPDGRRIRKEGVLTGWTVKTWIPLITNASGGIIVGLVTKYAGVVRKGFALILGMFLSGVLQNVMSKEEKRVSVEQWVGGVLAAISLWMHSAFPT